MNCAYCNADLQLHTLSNVREVTEVKCPSCHKRQPVLPSVVSYAKIIYKEKTEGARKDIEKRITKNRVRCRTCGNTAISKVAYKILKGKETKEVAYNCPKCGEKHSMTEENLQSYRQFPDLIEKLLNPKKEKSNA